MEDIRAWQQEDPEIRCILRHKSQSQHRPTAATLQGNEGKYLYQWDNLEIIDGILYRLWWSEIEQNEVKHVLVVPQIFGQKFSITFMN